MIKMSLGMEVGLGPGDFVLDGDPAPLRKKGAEPAALGSCLWWPNGWMDQGDTVHGGGPRTLGPVQVTLCICVYGTQLTRPTRSKED